MIYYRVKKDIVAKGPLQEQGECMANIDIKKIIGLFLDRGALAKILQCYVQRNDYDAFVGEGYSLFGATDIPTLKSSSLVTLLKMEGEKYGDNIIDLTAVFSPQSQGYSCFKANGRIRDVIIAAIEKETNV